MAYTLRKNVMPDDALRPAYCRLAREVFGLPMEEWYQDGWWTEAHLPYTLFDGETAAANVSVNRMDLLWQGERRSYIQLGTVATDPRYRGKGLARRVMEAVLEDWAHRCRTMFLLANRTVLDFYPRFGFASQPQFQYKKALEECAGEGKPLSLKRPGDLELFREFYRKTNTHSRLQAVDQFPLLMFYCRMGFGEHLLHLPQQNAVMIAAQEGETLRCWDVYGGERYTLSALLAAAARPGTKEAVLEFTPCEGEGFTSFSPEDEDNNLFLLPGGENLFRENPLYFPAVSHT